VNWSFVESWGIAQSLSRLGDQYSKAIRPQHLLLLSAGIFLCYVTGFSLNSLAALLAKEPEFILGMIVCVMAGIISICYLLSFFNIGLALRDLRVRGLGRKTIIGPA
jgi:hypothetical protein